MSDKPTMARRSVKNPPEPSRNCWLSFSACRGLSLILIIFILPPYQQSAHQTQQSSTQQRYDSWMGIKPELPASLVGSISEGTMSAIITIIVDRMIQIIRAGRTDRLTGLLRFIAGLSQVPVTESREKFI